MISFHFIYNLSGSYIIPSSLKLLARQPTLYFITPSTRRLSPLSTANMFTRHATLLFFTVATASQPGLLFGRQTMTGIATFNNYVKQGQTVCGPLSGVSGTFGAAAGDISPDISGGLCSATIDTSKCSGQNPISGYVGPACPKGNCLLCYKVTNNGAVGSATIGGIGNSITVQIIDSCPSVSAFNFCKTDVPLDQRCMSSTTNSLDIDESSYMALTGQAFASGVSAVFFWDGQEFC